MLHNIGLQRFYPEDVIMVSGIWNGERDKGEEEEGMGGGNFSCWREIVF